MVRYAELSAADRKQIRSGRSRSPRRPGLTMPAHQDRSGGTFTCTRCRQVFPTYPPAERHVDTEHRYGRIECQVY